MSVPTPDEQKRRMMTAFDTMAVTYDEIRFIQHCAHYLIEHADLRPGSRVLDVATGTGLVAAVAARIVGPEGRVTGIDIAEGMLAKARQRAASQDAAPIVFRVADAENLDFPDNAFDTVLCASGLFFMPDISRALQEAYRVLAPGGTCWFTGFGPGLLQPLIDLWRNRLQLHGLNVPPLPHLRMASEAVCRQLTEAAGFHQVTIEVGQVGYYAASVHERWSDIVGGLEGMPYRQLPPDLQEQIKSEHLAELEALPHQPEGIWMDVPVILVMGRNP